MQFFDASHGLPLTWLWDFGDGQTVDGNNAAAEDPPTHSYTAVGTYTVNLTVTNAYGSTTTGIAPAGPSVRMGLPNCWLKNRTVAISSLAI